MAAAGSLSIRRSSFPMRYCPIVLPIHTPLMVRQRRARRLIPDEITDETDDFISILEKYNIPFEESNGVFIIYGYRSY